jgi:hypothetical protein
VAPFAIAARVTGSFVLVTEAATRARLAERAFRLRCVDCGEMHLLTLTQETFSAARPQTLPRNSG